jgi:Fe-S cluster assembly ATPase SufC
MRSFRRRPCPAGHELDMKVNKRDDTSHHYGSADLSLMDRFRKQLRTKSLAVFRFASFVERSVEKFTGKEKKRTELTKLMFWLYKFGAKLSMTLASER